VLGAAWAAPVVVLAVAAPGAAASQGNTLTYSWAIETPPPAATPPLWTRFAVVNSTPDDVTVVFRATRAQGEVTMTSVTQATGWVPVEPSTLGVFERTAVVAAGTTRSMLLGFDGASGASAAFQASLIPSIGSTLTPSFPVIIP